MLEIKEIKKEYRTAGLTQKALDGVSLNLRDSEFVAVLGPSGSGKTTLLNIVGGLDQADSGDLVINGVSTAKYKDRDWDTYRNHTIGFVFQSYNLIPHQSVLSNVELALTISGISGEGRRKKAEKALRSVGLGEHMKKLPSQLSGGQMQRVAIARALVTDPDIVLADEPTGALDSETGDQVMKLLKEVSRERLVVMVTHNPELAKEYATRIVTLRDGKITSDSDPFDPAKEASEDAAASAAGAAAGTALSAAEGTAAGPGAAAADADTDGGSTAPAGKPKTRAKKKASMSFLTALSLSAKNLWTKKARTILVAFAGSIGIIGIALILSLSNGVNRYIEDVERDTLSEYPLQIQDTGFDITGLLAVSQEKTDSVSSNKKKKRDITEIGTITDIFAKSNSNDLKSFKKFLDSKESGIREHVSTIEYKYNVTPVIYRDSDKYETRKVNPDDTFAPVGISGSSSTASNMMSYAMSTDIFSDLPEDEKTYKEQYDVKAGHWPEKENELVLVLARNGQVVDLALYVLGRRDPGELKQAVKDFSASEQVTISDKKHSYDYDDFLGEEFRLVINSDMYKYDKDQGVFIDKSADKDYMKALVKKSEKLKIVGVVEPKPGGTAAALQIGIAYTPELIRHIINKTKDSDIVKAQRDHPDKNMLTGKPFGEEEGKDFDLRDMFSVDEGILKSAFNFDTGKLTLDPDKLAGMDMSGLNMNNMTNDVKIKMTRKSMNSLFNDLMKDYEKQNKGKKSTDPDKLAEGFTKYLATDGAKQIMAGLATAETEEDTQEILQKLYAGYTMYAMQTGEANPLAMSDSISKYMSSAGANQIMAKHMAGMIDSSKAEKKMQKALGKAVKGYMTSAMKQLSDGLQNAMSVDPEVFASAIQVNMDEKDLESMLAAMMTTRTSTYESNMKDFGYADLKKPSMILLYPKDFESKEQVTKIIDGYNKRVEAAGEKEKAISYSDLVGTLMSSVTDIINQISMVLIAFVAISLIVSSIMIGVITYISVLERKKEIGILRAMGASKGNIANVFNAETFIIGALAGLFGIGLSLLLLIPGNAIIQTLADGTEMRARMPAGAAVILIVLSIILTLIGGWIPSRKAAKSDPVTALRTE